VSCSLGALGLRVLPSNTNFIFFTLPLDASEVSRMLLERGVIVRPCGGWGFPRSIRVTVGTAEDNSFFLEALGQVLAERKGERE
jgi:histidinol-phosphate aminotransferase